MRIDPVRDAAHFRGSEAALSRASDLGCRHEVDLFENADVLLDPVDSQAEGSGQLAERGGAVAETVQDASAGWIRQCEKRAVQG
jgi:hypothetical protein